MAVTGVWVNWPAAVRLRPEAVAVAASLSWKVVPSVTVLTVAPVGMLALPVTAMPATTPVVLATVTLREPEVTEPPVNAKELELSEPPVMAQPMLEGVPAALFPSWPLPLPPQLNTLPSEASPTAKSPPAATWVKVLLLSSRPATATGVPKRSRLEVPSRPSELAPQAATFPVVSNASVWALPKAYEVGNTVFPASAPASTTGAGAAREVVELFPNWPLTL